jgi:hypothetical protein
MMGGMGRRDELRVEVLRYIQRGISAPADEEGFRRLALAVFEYQFAENEPYRRFCERRNATPDVVSGWREIPAVPAAAFKEASLICGGADVAEAVFRTSGTSQGRGRRGAHYVRDLQLYEASALPNFAAHLLPDGAHLRTLVLGPNAELAPDSSLSWMLELVRRKFGTPESAHYVDENGLLLEELLTELENGENVGRPVMLLGTAAAFVHVLDAIERQKRVLQLAPGTRLMETGGFKGQNREVTREELYATLSSRLGISEHYCVAEYGMTEMCSQFYDNVLHERARARPLEWRYKVVPPWVRTRVVDAETLEPVSDGSTGLLLHLDLANLDSVMAILTEDLGVADHGGFEILGRAAGAELRGCSMAMDQWLTAQR